MAKKKKEEELHPKMRFHSKSFIASYWLKIIQVTTKVLILLLLFKMASINAIEILVIIIMLIKIYEKKKKFWVSINY